jgi:hypothetical protein
LQREREQLQAERQFPPDKRTALLALLDRGVPFKDAVAELGVRAHHVWGRARSDSKWGTELQATIDQARFIDGIEQAALDPFRGYATAQ